MLPEHDQRNVPSLLGGNRRDQPMRRARPRRTPSWLIFAVLAVAAASFALMQSMTVPVLPRIETEMQTDQATVTWVLTAYLLSASVFTPILGRIGDAVGKERLLVVALLALCSGSIVAALAPSIEVLIGARVVQGIGGAVMPLAFGIIRDELPPRRVTAALSVVSSLTSFGFGIGIVLGGPLVDLLGYPWLFWLPAIVTGTAAVATLLFIPPSPVRTRGRVSVLPAVLLAGFLVTLLLSLSRAPEWGWTSRTFLAGVSAAALLAAVWIATEYRVATPLVDMRMMRRRGVWTTNLVALLVGVGMYASFGFLPQFIQTPSAAGYGFGATVTESGLLILPMACASFVAGLIAAPAAARVGAKAVVISGCLLAAAGMLLMAVTHDGVLAVMIVNALSGLGVGLAFACLAGLIIDAVPAGQTGIASGMNANIRTIGGSIGTALMSSIVAARVLPSGLPAEVGYTRGFLLLGAVFGLAALAGLSIPGRNRARKAPTDEATVAVIHAGVARESLVSRQ